jgi:hypothetical protein
MRRLDETLLLLAGQDPSIDSDELIDRLERHLSEGIVPVVARDGSSIMQPEARPRQTSPPQPSRKVWVFAAALLAVVAAIGIPMWLLGGEDPQDVASDSDAVFSWRDGDDISAWVTVDEMKAMFGTLTKRYAGVELGDADVVFASPGSGVYTDQWDWSHDPVSGPGSGTGWLVSVQGDVVVGAVQGDRRLPEGAVFQPGWGWEHILRGPNSHEAIQIGLTPPREFDLGPYPDRREPYDDMYFEVASMMLRELGWAD